MRIILIIPVLFLFSCFEEDKPIAPFEGEIIYIENNIGKYQSYFDLETKKVLAFNDTSEWDIGFSSAPSGWDLKVNSAKELFVYNTGITGFSSEVLLPSDDEWKYDDPGGDKDSTAFGMWCDTMNFPYISKGFVYLIGKKTPDKYVEYARIQLIRADENHFLFHYNTFDDKTMRQGEAVKNDSVNYIYFNLTEGTQKNLEPSRSKWDILFTPYYDLLFDDNGTPVPYFLRGVFINTGKVRAYAEKQILYTDFYQSDIDEAKFSTRQDIIGYDWKDVNIDFNGGTAIYYVIPGLYYIIFSSDGNIYKLRFRSYTLEGENGYPGFEYSETMSHQP